MPDATSLDNFQLPTNLLADFYKDSLVILDFPQNSSPLLNEKKTEHLGGYQSGLLILVNSADVPYLHDDELQLLSNMLHACKLSLADAAIVNTANTEQTNWDTLLRNWEPKKLIAFGPVLITNIPPLNKNEIKAEGETLFLQAEALTTLTTQPTEKKALWIALQQLFQLQ
jgi:hypothetical protein